MKVSLVIFVFTLFSGVFQSEACTSLIAGPEATASGRPLLWKHRDTSCESNFIERVKPQNGCHGYIALFNAGDSLLSEAWIGVNDADFAIMNTASYNLVPDTAVYKDREGYIMTEALKRCSCIDDFRLLLDRLPKPLGVQANFGVIDAMGNGAYFETDDYTYTEFNIADAPDGVIIRTNYSISGEEDGGYGYIRHDNASALLAGKISEHALTPADMIETASRSFYNSVLDNDAAESSCRWVIDSDFIPRYSSSASIVIEGATLDKSGSVMWTALGYPPCAIVQAATVDCVPDDLRPTLPGYKSPECEAVLKKKHKAFPIKRGSGSHYIDMQYLRPVVEACRKKSLENYVR